MDLGILLEEKNMDERASHVLPNIESRTAKNELAFTKIRSAVSFINERHQYMLQGRLESVRERVPKVATYLSSTKWPKWPKQ